MSIDKSEDDRVEYVPPNRTNRAPPRPQSALATMSNLSPEDFRRRFEAEWVQALQQVTKPYEVGQIVEALGAGTTRDTYALYYTAEIKEISEDAGRTKFKLLYEDGTEDDEMNPMFVKPNTRALVYEDDLLKVIDGHIAVKGIRSYFPCESWVRKVIRTCVRCVWRPFASGFCVACVHPPADD
eukprot:2709293-Pyramimonas_sp.AAC.1